MILLIIIHKNNSVHLLSDEKKKNMKSMLKSELADLAGVSPSTFGRWLKRHSDELESMGVSSKTKVCPPIAVRYICEQYGIDIDV